MKASVCKSVCVSRGLCVKASVCRSLCVQKRLCVKASLCVKVFVRNTSVCISVCV